MCAFRYVTTQKWIETIRAQLETLALEHVPVDVDVPECAVAFKNLIEAYVHLLDNIKIDHYYMRLHLLGRIDALLEYCLASRYFVDPKSLCLVNKIRSTYWQCLPQMREEYEKDKTNNANVIVKCKNKLKRSFSSCSSKNKYEDDDDDDG